jgi:sarcosine oxidase subunit beta
VAGLFGQSLYICPERHEAMVIHLDPPLDYIMPMVMDLVNGRGPASISDLRNATS